MAERTGFDPNIDIPRAAYDQSPGRAICVGGCGRTPEEIYEYSPTSTGTDLSPEAYVAQEEGTYNRTNGHFMCTACYIKDGMPSAPGGWVAP